MDDKRYSVRVSTFKAINPFTIDLRGCGQLYIVPRREYFFINAPINFINYIAQLATMHISYRLTTDSNGCYYTVDLMDYFKNDPTYIMGKIRRHESPIIKEPEVKKEPESTVVIASDDFVPRDEKVADGTAEAELDKMIAEDLQKEQEVEITEPVAEVKPEEPVEEVIEENTSEEPKVYTEAELSRLGKVKLLEISASLGLDYSDINTKKEIRDGILEAQNK